MSGELTTAFVSTAMSGLGYEVLGGHAAPIFGGTADSRLVKTGYLFSAFRGERLNGNDYLEEAVTAGAVATVSERRPLRREANCTYVIGSDSRQTMADLARTWRAECPAQVIGITGTVGKTTAKELLAGALDSSYRTHRSPGNFNSREGLPLALCSLTKEHEISVLEMAMDSAGEIAELCDIAKPDVGIVLNIGRTHVSKLGSIEAIAAEKLALPRELSAKGTAVLNADDSRVAASIPELSCKVLTFGIENDADVRGRNIRGHGLEGTEFDVTYGRKTVAVALAIPGLHVVPAALASIAAMLAVGMRFPKAAEAVTNANVPGRMNVAKSRKGFTILDDRYNSSPASLDGALRMLGGLAGRRIALLGEMAELGEFSEEEHLAIGKLCATTCDAVFAVGLLCQHLVDAAKEAGLEQVTWFPTKEAAAAAALEFASAGDYVLVKASRGQAFETVLPLLEGTA